MFYILSRDTHQNFLSLEDALAKSSYDKNNLNYIKQFLLDNYSDNDMTNIFLNSNNNENIFVIEYTLSIELNLNYYKVYILVYLPPLFPNVQPEIYIEKRTNLGLNEFYKNSINSLDFKINLDYFIKFDKNKRNIGEIIDNLVINFTMNFPIYKETNDTFNWKNSGKCVLLKRQAIKVNLPKKNNFNYNKKQEITIKRKNIDNNNKYDELLEEYKEKINKLNESINDLTKKNLDLNEKLSRYPFILEKNEKLISIIISSVDHSINYSLICKNTNTINDIEKDIYKEFPEYAKKNNIFLCKGKMINKFETFESNHIKNGDILVLEKIYA